LRSGPMWLGGSGWILEITGLAEKLTHKEKKKQQKTKYKYEGEINVFAKNTPKKRKRRTHKRVAFTL